MIPHADTCTCPDCIRIAAFGAIRRVLTVARRHEFESRIRPELAYAKEHAVRAHAMRRAIRAAIGSEKMPV